MSIVLRLLGLSAVAALSATAAASWLLTAPDTELAVPSTTAEVKRVTFASLPSVNAHAGPSLLERSPYAPDRSAFDRDRPVAPPPPPVEVRLTGIFKVGKEFRASLMINGQSIVVRRGDETAAGKVAKIESGAILLSGSIEQRLEIFR